MNGTLRLYDTLTRQAAPVEPRDGDRLTVYLCGPTVYSYIHVGNARPFWLGQVLKRFVEQRLGGQVYLVENITDINDEIYVAAQRTGERSDELAARFAQAYIDDTDGLGLGRPDVEPRASETLPEIIALIERLIQGGLAYEAGGDVYFSVSAFPGYGELSGQRVEQLVDGARVEPGEHKREPADFALWKANKPDEDTWWESPWGRGRPGWHIECSAMAAKFLGPGFDVHGGGLDLVFPHHENERAQSEGAGDVPFARRWLHNGMLRLASEKMSKSEGNVESLRDALASHGRETLLAFFAAAKYRNPVDYTEATLEQARRTTAGLREALGNARRYAAAAGGSSDRAVAERAQEAGRAFDEALANDLDTPAALAVLHGLATDLNRAVAAGEADPAAVGEAADALVACLRVLGLDSLDGGAAGDGEAPSEVQALLAEREAARAARDFARADEARDAIAAHGFDVRDTPQGPQLVRREP
jgi:cysteinyl-tRNA synthetase